MTKTTSRNFKVGHEVLVLLLSKNFETIGAVDMIKPCWFQGQVVQKQRDRLPRKYVEEMV